MVDDWTNAQLSVIGSALIDGACVPEILAEMRPEDFTGEYRRYYDAFRQLAAENTSVDPVTVLNIIGPAYRELTAKLMKNTVTSTNVRAYIQVCKEQSRLRLLRGCGFELSDAATLADAREALAKASTVSVEANRRTSWTAGECVSEWLDALNAGEKPEYITSGVGSVDHTLRTVAGNFVIIAGYTSHGKTAMALQMARGIAKKKRVGFFSFEMTRKEWTDRLISFATKIPLQKIQDKDLTMDETRRCIHAANELYELPLTYERAFGFTLDDIRARLLQKQYEVIVVDYLQKISVPTRGGDRYRAVTEISSGLQTIGHLYNVAVYALSQLSRAEDEKDGYIPPPKLSDLRESGQLEQDADAVLFVHAPFKEAFPEFRMLNIAKNRSGILKSYYADFSGDTQTFSEPTQEHGERYRRLMQGKNFTGPRSKGGRSFSKLQDVNPTDNPFAQDALPL